MSIDDRADPTRPMSPARPEDLLAHAAWVRGVAFALVRDAATADDLVQETWLAALRRPPEGGRPLRPWLAGVVRNLVRHRRRGEARRGQREEVVAERRSADALPTPDELAERLETQQRLTAHVNALDEPFRATVLLRYFEGLSAAEMARRDGVPAGTVRWRLKRALDLLRERLDAEYDGDRRAWVLALVPIATPDASSGTAAGSGSVAAAVQGVVAMGLGAKLLLGGTAAVVAIALAAVTMDGVFGGPDEVAPETPVEVAYRPEAVAPRVRVQVPTITDAADVATESPAADSTNGPPHTRPPASIEGRALDRHGNPLSGVLVRAADFGRVEVTTDEDGTFRLEFTLPDGARSESVRLTAPGYATRSTEVPVARDETSYAGDIELAPGGSVIGRVVGTDGRPMADAWVGISDDRDLGTPYGMRRRMRSPSLYRGSKTRTATDGSFRLAGVPAGTRRIWTGYDNHLSTLSGPIDVRAGLEGFGVELVLERLADEDVIEGRVIAPDGTPLPDADLEYSYSASFGQSGGGSMSLEQDGSFRIVLFAPATYRLTASDPSNRWGGVSLGDVEGGMRDIVLRLPENRYVELHVADRGGAPAGAFNVMTNDPEHGTLFDRSSVSPEQGGVARVRVPAQPFHIEVEADGFDTGRLGPLDPNAVPDVLRIELDALPGLSGRVTADDTPVDGARVSLHPVLRDGDRWTHNGFDTRWNPTPVARTTTDPDGAYHMTVRDADQYVLRVEHDGRAPWESAPFAHEPGIGRSDLDAQLRVGGSIEGRVFAESSRSPAGTIVGISRGDGHPISRRVGPDGQFRFGHLTPGEWEVRRLDDDIVAGTSSTTMIRGSFRADWSCTVHDGAVTHHDLGSVTDVGARLVGQVTRDGDPAAGWTLALLELTGGMTSSDTVQQVDRNGAVAIRAEKPGEYRGLVRSNTSRLSLLREMSLPTGETAFDLDVPLGAVNVTGAPWNGGDTSRPDLALVWIGPDAWMGLVPIVADEDGVANLPEVPAGTVRLARFDPDRPDPDPMTWRVLREVVVPRGGTLELALDVE